MVIWKVHVHCPLEKQIWESWEAGSLADITLLHGQIGILPSSALSASRIGIVEVVEDHDRWLNKSHLHQPA